VIGLTYLLFLIRASRNASALNRAAGQSAVIIDDEYAWHECAFLTFVGPQTGARELGSSRGRIVRFRRRRLADRCSTELPEGTALELPDSFGADAERLGYLSQVLGFAVESEAGPEYDAFAVAESAQEVA
jgi:hypothetical protein